MTDNTEALPPHPSHDTVRDWMPVSEALRLADLWTVGDLDNSGQWRAAIKVLADEVRAALAQRQQVPRDAGPAGEFGKHFGCSGPIDLTAAPSAQAEPKC